jgi:hypothetical protein
MVKSGYFKVEAGALMLSDVKLGVELEEYVKDLLEYGLGRYEIDFGNADPKEPFHLWGKYKKEQVQQLLLNNPKDIMKGTKIIGDTVYIYVTVRKEESIKAELKYADGYIDNDTFQWETVANISNAELTSIKNSKLAQVFVRKVGNEDGIQLPFTYIGAGKPEFNGKSNNENDAYLFRIPMNVTAPDDIYFDFKLPELG